MGNTRHIWIILLLSIMNLLAMVTGECEGHQVEIEGHCCSKCPIGSGATSFCSAENDTKCERCTEGETFSNNSSHIQTCSKCSQCPKNSQVLRDCNSTSDTICVCDKDFYLADDGQCRLCDLCPAGWGASVSCNRFRNTMCQRCTNGTFSKELSATSNCLVCSVCVPGAQMLQLCSTTEDTICISLPIYRYTTDSLNVQATGSGDRRKDIDIIPLYCAILGAVVIGLLGYVIMVHYRRMKEKRLVREPHDDVEYSKASAGDSGICVEVDHHQKISPVFLSSATKIRDIPNSKRKEIERSFLQSSKDPRDWQGLARELGFSTKKIANCELKSQRDSTTPLKQLLTEWSRNDNATVGILIQSMKNLGRHDVLPALNVYNSAELRPLMPQGNIV